MFWIKKSKESQSPQVVGGLGEFLFFVKSDHIVFLLLFLIVLLFWFFGKPVKCVWIFSFTLYSFCLFPQKTKKETSWRTKLKIFKATERLALTLIFRLHGVCLCVVGCAAGVCVFWVLLGFLTPNNNQKTHTTTNTNNNSTCTLSRLIEPILEEVYSQE